MTGNRKKKAQNWRKERIRVIGMSQMELKRVKTREEIEEAAMLAREIWTEHFTPIIGEGQVEYMLEHFQSAPAISEMIASAYFYQFIILDSVTVGYTAYRPQTEGEEAFLFLSKLYIKKEFRGRKLASFALSQMEAYCREARISAVRLTCNRHNENTLAVYRSLGFKVLKEQDADIGGGYFMNDYVMEKKVEQE